MWYVSLLLSNCIGGIPEVCKHLFSQSTSNSDKNTCNYDIESFHKYMNTKIISCRDLVHISKEIGEGSRSRIADDIFSIWNKCSNEIEIYYASTFSFSTLIHSFAHSAKSRNRLWREIDMQVACPVACTTASSTSLLSCISFQSSLPLLH